MRGQAETLSLVLIVGLVVAASAVLGLYTMGIIGNVGASSETSLPALRVDYARFVGCNILVGISSLSGPYDGNVSLIIEQNGRIILSATAPLHLDPGSFAELNIEGVHPATGMNLRVVAGPFSTQVPIRYSGNWLANFCHRMKVVVEAASSASDYQVHVFLDTNTLIENNLMRPDCGDLRVTLADGVTEIPYWFNPQTCGEANTSLWFLAPKISEGNNVFYIYFGSPSASSASSPDGVFLRLSIPNSDFREGNTAPTDVCPSTCPVADWNCGCKNPTYSKGVGPERLVDSNYPWAANGFLYHESRYWNVRKAYVTLGVPPGYVPGVVALRVKPYIESYYGNCHICGPSSSMGQCGQLWFGIAYSSSPPFFNTCTDHNCVIFWWIANGATSPDRLEEECNIQSVRLQLFSDWEELVFDGDILVPAEFNLEEWAGTITFSTHTYPGGSGPVSLSVDDVRIYLRKYGLVYNVSLGPLE